MTLDIIFKTIYGSRLYGTALETSDVDVKGVYIPTAKEIVLGPIREVEDVNHEESYYSLKKYMDLLVQGQMVALEMLFAPWDPDVILSVDPRWEEIYRQREKLFSKRTSAFISYCRAQANNYNAKSSRLAAADQMLEFFSKLKRSDKVSKFAEELEEIKDEFIEVVDVEQNSTTGVKFLKHVVVCDRKIPYTVRVSEAVRILTTLVNEYGLRAKMINSLTEEKKRGADWKAMAHAVRIGEQSLEFLRTRRITLPRPNAEELVDIRLGNRGYNEISERVELLLHQVEKEIEICELPDDPDVELARDIIYNTYLSKVLTG